MFAAQRSSRQFRTDRPDRLRVTDNTGEQMVAAIDRHLYGLLTS